MKGVRFNRLAERELQEAIVFYDEESPGLGDRFLDEVETGTAFILSHPEASPRILGTIRRLVLPSFPYSLLYRPLPSGGIRILAVAHQKRQPDYWIGRR
ncbi:MAG: type II toxin-antitoxin system RelE/ParE family toxin [Thermoanaerobaculia bacterium]